MTHLVSFRPNVAGSETAFEAVADIYEYLYDEYGYKITIVQADSQDFERATFDIRSVSGLYWNLLERFKDHSPFVPTHHRLVPDGETVRKLFRDADGVITVDPTTRTQGRFAIRQATDVGTPVWFDAGRTIARPSRSVVWKLRRRRLTRLLEDTAGIIVTSPKVIERFRDLKLFRRGLSKKFTVMGHPTDTTEFRPVRGSNTEGPLRILTVARLIPEKGYYYVLEALEPILRRRDDVTYDILGTGPMEPLLAEEIDRRGLAEVVTIRDKVPHQKVPAILNEADIFVNHAVDTETWEEYFGAVNIEAMACGLPCVLTDCGSVPYVVREDVASIVNQRDVNGIRTAIKLLLNDEQRRIELGDRACEFVEHEYSVEAIGEKYHRMIQSEIG